MPNIDRSYRATLDPRRQGKTYQNVNPQFVQPFTPKPQFAASFVVDNPANKFDIISRSESDPTNQGRSFCPCATCGHSRHEDCDPEAANCLCCNEICG